MLYDVAVIGGGAAGCMAAINAAHKGCNTVLIEKNQSLGKKLKLTGKGRCNITNIANLDTFLEKFGKEGKFLRTAFSVFSNTDLIDFFESFGLKLVLERQGRVFPKDYSADSVIKVLEKCLNENKVKILKDTHVISIKKNESFEITLENKKSINAKKVIIATGGASYRTTGSTGDGFRFAEALGHTTKHPKPGLVPLKTKETWVRKLQGLTLKNVRITFSYSRKKIISKIGELLFTHFGISGPLVLDLSAEIVSLLEEHKEIALFIDLKPALSEKRIEEKLIDEFKERGNTQLKNVLKSFLPQKLIPFVMHLAGADPIEKTNQIRKEIRHKIATLFKALPLTVTGSLPLNQAMVTCGGISTKEINPKTMESKIIQGLYFAGEIIDGRAPSGGFNLQQAFSTGFLAGQEVAKCIKGK